MIFFCCVFIFECLVIVRLPLGEIHSVYKTPERLFGLAKATTASIHIVVSRRWIKRAILGELSKIEHILKDMAVSTVYVTQCKACCFHMNLLVSKLHSYVVQFLRDPKRHLRRQHFLLSSGQLQSRKEAC